MSDDGCKVKVNIPSRYAGNEHSVKLGINTRLVITSRCPNPWHDSAPVRAVELCPECPR